MTENNNQTKTPWFFLREYPNVEHNAEHNVEHNAEHVETTSELPQEVPIEQRIEKIASQLEDMNNKLEKLIQSHKSFIAYFSAINDTDARDLNYKIRSYSNKTNQLPPVNFVPDRRSVH